jgi:hypothetical protein
MIPKPWSHSALEDFINCPRSYYAKRVEKRFPYEPGPEALYGIEVHKHFEDRLRHGVALPEGLREHEEYLARLEALPGIGEAEQDIALNRSGKACGYWDPDVWYRGKVDYLKVNGDHARVYDWKTGKQHQKLMQLHEYILWVFACHPEVMKVYAEFYWTKHRTVTGITLARDSVPALWAMIIPDLRQMLEAYQSDIWQPRQSGLCKRHCPVTDCEFNGLGGNRR